MRVVEVVTCRIHVQQGVGRFVGMYFGLARYHKALALLRGGVVTDALLGAEVEDQRIHLAHLTALGEYGAGHAA